MQLLELHVHLDVVLSYPKTHLVIIVRKPTQNTDNWANSVYYQPYHPDKEQSG